MRMDRVLPLAKSEIKKTLREPGNLFILVVFPMVLTIAFATSFGAMGGDQTTYSVGVVSYDGGGIWSESLVQNMSATGILSVQIYESNLTAHDDLVQGKVQAVLVVPEGFSASCQAYLDNPSMPSSWSDLSLPIYVDKGSLVATQAIPPIVSQSLQGMLGAGASAQLPVRLAAPSLLGVQQVTGFDIIAPGLFAYASIFLTMTVAQSFTSNREKGLLKRIGLTPVTAGEFMISQLLANMLMAVVQVAIVFAMAMAMGWQPATDAFGVLVGLVLLMAFSVCNVGFGLITATLAKSPGAATGLAFLFVLPQMFLGTFVGSMLSQSAREAGHFVPAYYVTDALTSLFLRGAPVSSGTVLVDLVVTILSSIVILGVGVLVFRRYGNR